MKRTHRHVPIIIGILSFFAAAFILFCFDGFLSLLAGAFLAMFGWGSLKTGLFATEKELTELCEPGSVSEETKKRFMDRL